MTTFAGNYYFSDAIRISVGGQEIAAPEEFTAKMIGDNKVMLTWKDIAQNEKQYILLRGNSRDSLVIFDSLNKNSESYLDTLGQIYGNDKLKYYGIKAINSHNESQTVYSKTIIEIQNNPVENLYEEFQIYPNPFKSTATIRYGLQNGSFISLTLFNMLGEVIQEVKSEYYDKGNHTLYLNGEKLSSGLYILQLRQNNVVKTLKVLLIK